MKSSLLQLLHCPLCGGKFCFTRSDQVSTAAIYGILTCYCGCYPVVEGIPVLKKDKTSEKVVSLIKDGKNLKALLTLISPVFRQSSLLPYKVSSFIRKMAHQKAVQRWHKKAMVLLSDQQGKATVCDFLDLYCQNKEHYNYFAFRFGQPRHLVALSFTTLIDKPNKPILDLSCGCGHITRNLSYRAKAQQVIGTDRFFFGLYIAKHWIAPQAEYVCCSSDSSLPFQDGSFSLIFCSDAFHYLVNKVTTIRELKASQKLKVL
jgi:uncharacterized protein YbaR (Trm112 family)